MKIKTLTRLCTGLLIVFAAAIGAVVYFASRQTERIVAQGVQADRVIIGAFELDQLTQQYIERFEERPQAQWYLQHDALARILASPALEDRPLLARTLSEEAAIDKLMRALRDDMADIRTSFDALVQRSGEAASDRALAHQLSSDLTVKAQRMILHAGRLAELSAQERAKARRRTDLLSISLLILLALLSSVILLLVYRRVLKSLANLQKGARRVGEGDLSFRIENRRDDEIGELARAFDAMTSKLKASYDTLEDKVRERTAELHALSRRNKILLDSIGDGIIAIDRLWNITLWNPSAARLTGWEASEAIGRPFRDRVRFIHENDRTENLSFIEDAMLMGETRAMANSTLLVTRDGREVPVGDSAAPILDDEGRVAGVIIIFRDVTREKDANMLRSDFAYASHQLRTPVNKALWSLELALDEAADPEQRERLRLAYHSVSDVKKLTSRLVDVSLIDQHQVVPSYADTPIAGLMKEAVASVAADAKERGVSLRVKPIPKGLSVDTDAKLLKAALQELLDNAIRYSASGAAVEASVRAEGLELVIQVSDRGIGIPEDQKTLIFTKFFRGQNVPQESYGTGLGLFIARAYVKLLGGKLWFESKQEQGTTFMIALPRVRGMKK